MAGWKPAPLVEPASCRRKKLFWRSIYKGNRVLELLEDIDLPEDIEVLVIIPVQDDEKTLRGQLQSTAEAVFSRLWDNREDEIWNEYL